MRARIVEGEPGIFPDPVARVLVGLGRWVRGRLRRSDDSSATDEHRDDDGDPAAG